MQEIKKYLVEKKNKLLYTLDKYNINIMKEDASYFQFYKWGFKENKMIIKKFE